MPKDSRPALTARRIVAFAIVLLLALVPVIAGLAGQPFYVTLISRMMIFALAALGLNLILGYGAMVSFGHALYIGIGAYSVGILSFYGVTNGYAHVATALIAGLIIATLVGMVCLRTSGVAFIMITLAFAQMFYFLAVSLKQLGGDDGYGLPSRSDFGVIDLSNNTTLYYVIFACCCSFFSSSSGSFTHLSASRYAAASKMNDACARWAFRPSASSSSPTFSRRWYAFCPASCWPT